MKLLLSLMLLCGCIPVTADDYISQLRHVIEESRHNLPEFIKSADEAAKRFTSGGKILVAGTQKDFISEACGRAGGLMSIRRLEQETPSDKDIVLYASAGKPSAADEEMISKWEKSGTQVVRFCSSAKMYKDKFPVDTLANVINLWTWTGEFASACTRLGKMPVFYQSYGLPGGRERGGKYKDKQIHDDLNIKPVSAGTLGRAYLDKITAYLMIVQQQHAKIKKAAQWWRIASKKETVIFNIGHMFPQNFRDSRLAQSEPFSAAPAWEDKELITETNPPKFVLYLGYQYAPHRLIEQAKWLKINLVYTDVQRDTKIPPTENIIYINPGWPLADGCVSVEGYDVPILPASGVMTAAIYWEILSEKQ